MRASWTRAARVDLNRVEAFLYHKDPDAARRAVRALLDAPSRLSDSPRLGAPLPDFAPREVRRLKVGRYEMRYEILEGAIRILHIWHEREDRPFGPQ